MKPIEKVTYWRDPQLAGVEISQVSGSRHVFPAHAHDGIYAISMMASGGSYCLGPEKSCSLVAPGQIALISPNQMHSGVPVPGEQISYRMLYFDVNLMASAAAEITPQTHTIPEFGCLVVTDALLWRRLQHLFRVVHGRGGRLEKESAIMNVLAHLIPIHGNVKSKQAPRRCGGKSIQQAMAFLSENLDRKISLHIRELVNR